MSTDDEDLRINTLHALTKHSPQVVLEEHGHCEVPAGCGGVVLRWRDPAAGIPCILRVAARGVVRVWVDDAEVTNTWVSLMPGRHVVAVEVADAPLPSLVVLALVYQQARDQAVAVSSTDWRVCVDPSPGWRAPEFDDGDWARAQAATDLVAALDRGEAWRFQRVMEVGAAPLRIDAVGSAVRGTIRVVAP